jgi:hypothetical protein
MNKSEIITIVVISALIMFGGIGWAVTPKNEGGEPIIYSPSIKKTSDYQKSAMNWIAEIKLLDGRLNTLIATNNQGIYTKSKEAQDIFSGIYSVSQEIENTESPIAMQNIKDELVSTSSAYLDATQAALQWVSTSSDDNLSKTKQLITVAQGQLSELENSQWITQ